MKKVYSGQRTDIAAGDETLSPWLRPKSSKQENNLSDYSQLSGLLIKNFQQKLLCNLAMNSVVKFLFAFFR